MENRIIMEYLGNLVIIGIYLMLEVKFDEQIRATLGTWNQKYVEMGNKLIHSIWQNAGRLIIICAIIWNQPMSSEIIALSTFIMYAMFYWLFFDSIFAMGVLKKAPWYLGETSKIDKFFPKKMHVIVWFLKIIGLVASIYWVIRTA